MRVGDLLEWIAGALLTAAAYFGTGLAWPALIVAGAVLAYEAQCHAATPLPAVRLPRPRLPKFARRAT